MSTYTDLHNKIKESIVVNSHRGFPDDRETYQEVKLLNPNNIYRGKFYGSLNAKNNTIVGGEISNVTITDVTLSGKVILPSGLDLSKLGNDVALISTDLYDTRDNLIPALENAIYAEEASRKENDSYLSLAIKSSHIDVEDKMHALSVALTDEDTRISSELTGMLSAESVERKLHDMFLSGAIDTLDLRINKEIGDRAREDLELNKLIKEKESESVSRDNSISSALSTHIEDNVRQFADLEESLLSNFAINKHYMIKNSGNEGFYPYKAKDYCVNIFDLTLPEGTVYYKDGFNTRYNVGRIDLTNKDAILPLTFKTNQIESDEILSTLKEDYPYVFKTGDLQVPTGKNSYVVEFEPYTETTVDLSTQLEKSKFTVKSEFETYHQINLYNNVTKVKTDINLGTALRTFEPGFNNNILSGKFTIATSEPDFKVFICEDVPFNTTDLSSYSYGCDPAKNRISYLGGNLFKLEKNINAERYISLIDTLDEATHCHFGNIYETYDGISGIISDDIGIKQINARVFNLYNVGIVSLDRDANFNGTIKDNVVSGDVSSIVILSANVTETSANFDVVNKAELYKYNYLGVNESGTEEVIGYIVPTLYNKSIEDFDGYDQVSVNLSNLTWIDEFKSERFNNGVYVLKKAVIEGLWTLVDGPAIDSHNNTLEVKFNNSELYVRFTSYTLQQVIAQKYKIDIASKSIYNVDSCHTVWYRTKTINLGKFDQEISTPEKTYFALIEANEIDPNTSRYELKVDTSLNDIVKIEIPSKDVKELSREFFAVFHIDTGAIEKLIKIEFVKKVDGVEVPVVIFNEDHDFLYIKSNRWTTLMINEIVPEKFLVTDLDNNVSDAEIVTSLSANALTAEYGTIHNLTANSAYLSDEVANNLSIASLSQLSILDKCTYKHGDPAEGIEHISSLQDVLNLSVDNLSNELNEVSTFIYDKHYAKTLSTDISCDYVTPGHTVTKVVDQLLILDEVTFDTYRLTIRNGALNINLVEKYTTI